MKCEGGEREKSVVLRAKRIKSIADVLEEVAVVIDAHFNEFSETKSSLFLKKLISNQGLVDMNLLRRPGGLSIALQKHWNSFAFCPFKGISSSF